jgi:predicted CXXCH cytochrome family protein
MTETDGHPGQPRRIGRTLLWAACGLAVAGAPAWLWLSSRPNDEAGEVHEQRESDPAVASYVSDTLCSDCHWEIAKAYKTHPMAQSLNRVSAAPLVEDYVNRTSFSPLDNKQYRVERRGDDFFHHEIRRDRDGNEIYDQPVALHFALGSGKRGRSYLINREGKLFVSPIAWYSTKGRWDLAPGYPPGRHERFERRAIDMCLRCHVGRVNAVPDTLDTFGKPAFHEMSIGCQNCHGPGQAHVEFHQGGGESEETDPIVNPRRLSHSRRESVCVQCHLSGEEIILHSGKSAYDFRPGQHVNEFMSVFVRKNPGGETSAGMTAVDQVLQMRSSTCYQHSLGQMGCTSCHDPHSVPQATQRAEFFRSRCLSCHSEPKATCALTEQQRHKHPARNSCIHCHMPAYGASDIPHTAQTDHRILRKPTLFKSDSKGAQQSAPSKSVVFSLADLQIFDLSAHPISKSDLARARGIVLARIAERNGSIKTAQIAETILRPATRSLPKDVDVLEALATVCMLQNRPAEAVEYWKKVLRIDPRHEGILYSLSVFLARQREYPAAVEMFNRLIEVNPWHAEVHFLHAQVLANLGRTNESIRAARRALVLDPSLVEPYDLLAELYRRNGDPDKARRAVRTADRLRG